MARHKHRRQRIEHMRQKARRRRRPHNGDKPLQNFSKNREGLEL